MTDSNTGLAPTWFVAVIGVCVILCCALWGWGWLMAGQIPKQPAEVSIRSTHVDTLTPFQPVMLTPTWTATPEPSRTPWPSPTVQIVYDTVFQVHTSQPTIWPTLTAKPSATPRPTWTQTATVDVMVERILVDIDEAKNDVMLVRFLIRLAYLLVACVIGYLAVLYVKNTLLDIAAGFDERNQENSRRISVNTPRTNQIIERLKVKEFQEGYLSGREIQEIVFGYSGGNAWVQESRVDESEE